jgi:hypothetical protein
MTWVLLIGAGWLLVALLVGVLIGRGIRLADRKEADGADASDPNFVVDLTPPAGAPAIVAPGLAATESPAPGGTPASPNTPEHVRHPIPSARPPAVRNPVRAPERPPSPDEAGPF